MISVLILTRNEEQNLPGCLASLPSCDDVHVFDSLSTDATVAVARQMGAQVHLRRFDDYATQRNAALSTVPFKHPWVFILDADERMQPALWAEAVEAVQAAALTLSAFLVRRNDHFLGRRLRHAQILALYTRLVRIGHVRYTRAVNEFLEVEGTTAQLRHSFDHFSFSKGLSRWFEKHNQYSSMEARILAERTFRGDASLRTALFHADRHTRHRARKAIFYLLPCRPLVRWLYLLLVCGGILDGKAGLIYATLQAVYEWQIVLKTRELLARGSSASHSDDKQEARSSLIATSTVHWRWPKHWSNRAGRGVRSAAHAVSLDHHEKRGARPAGLPGVSRVVR